jgi:hypothetical protein
MTKPIYVAGPNGVTLPLKSGAVIAIRPVAKGEQYSLALTDAGRFVRLKEQRINGMGIERYMTNLGFVKAGAQDKHAMTLTDKIAVHDSIAFVEQASHQYAKILQSQFAGKRVTYVPFDLTKPIDTADVASGDGLFVVLLGLGIGISCGCVSVEYQTDARCKSAMSLADGWIVGPDDDPVAVPRATAYGGLIERAAYLIANTGLATVSRAMTVTDEPGDPFPRGRMTLALTDSTDSTDSTDYIEIGINGGDELVVQYRRAGGELVCERQGLEQMHPERLCLGDAVGSIAAVLMTARDQVTGNRVVSVD